MTEELEPKAQISITGSTGHLGSVLIPMLLEQGYALRCLYRKENYLLGSKCLSWIQGDLREDSVLAELLRNSDLLIHCASVISVGEDNQNEVYQVNVESSRRLIGQCLKNQVRLIYISSSTATIPEESGKRLDENSPLVDSKEFFYGWTKARAEELVKDAVLKEGLNAIILRPTALVGPPDRRPSRFGKTIFDLHHGRLPMISSGGYDLLDIRDFSQTVINSIDMGQKGEVYVTGGNYHTMKALASMVNRNKKLPVVSVNLLIGLLPLIELYSRFFPLRWPVNRESLLTLKTAPKYVDSSKAAEQLLHRTRPLEESVRDLIEWKNKEE